MSDSDEQLFDVKSVSSLSKGSDASSMSPKRKFKRLNKNTLDSDQQLFDQVEVGDKLLPKKPEKKVFAKKLMKMFYDGDEEPKQKKKAPKIQKPTEKKRLKQQKQSDEQSVKILETPNKVEPNENGKRKSKRKRSLDSADFDSSVSDSVSLIPSEEDSEEYSGPRRAKHNKKLLLKKKNEEKWKEYELKYSVEEKDDDVPVVEEGKAYYTGMEFNYNYGSKKDKNAVRSRNKLFGEFQLFNPDEEQQPTEMEPIQDELIIKPREIVSKPIEQFRFMSRVSLIRKARGLTMPENQVKSTVIEEAEKEIKEIQDKKAKESLMRLVTSTSISHEDNVEFDLAVSMPMLTRGKSTSVFNNTLYLKKISSEITTKDEDNQTNSQIMVRKKTKLTRDVMLRQMQNDIKERRSKFISLNDIKESFQKTDLNQLQLAKERMEKKKSQAFNGFVDDKEDSDYKPEEEQKEEDKEFKEILALDADEDQLFEDQCDQEDENKEEQNGEGEKKQNAEQTDKPLQPQQMIIEENQQDNLPKVDQPQQNQEIAQNQKPLEHESPQKIDLPSESMVDEDEPMRKTRKMEIEETPDKQKQTHFQNQHHEEEAPVKESAQQNKASIEKMEDDVQSKGIFKKLKDFAQKAHQQKIKKEKAQKIANEFLDEQAELGSDNESNDDKKKAIDHEAEQKQYEGEDLDADLQSLIDHAPYLNESDEEQAYQKFLLDQRLKDKEQLLRVIRGQFKKSKKQFMEDIESDDEKKKQERMEEIIKKHKQREDYEDEILYGKEDQVEDSDQEQQESANYLPVQPMMKQTSSVRSNPMELSIFSEPKSNSLNSTSVVLGLKNRGSLLSSGTDKSKISAFEQGKSKPTTKSTINRLYQKNVMASKKAVILGLKRTNSSKVE